MVRLVMVYIFLLPLWVWEVAEDMDDFSKGCQCSASAHLERPFASLCQTKYDRIARLVF
jgi:hypothetical protein